MTFAGLIMIVFGVLYLRQPTRIVVDLDEDQHRDTNSI